MTPRTAACPRRPKALPRRAAGRRPLWRKSLVALATVACLRPFVWRWPSPCAAFARAGSQTTSGAAALRRPGRWHGAGSRSYAAAAEQAERRAAQRLRRAAPEKAPVPASSTAASHSQGLLAAVYGTVRRRLPGAVGVLTGLVGLLYMTSAFEALMHRSAGMLTGRGPLVGGLTGLAAGMLHTFAGPDHLAGLAPLVVGQRRTPLAALGLGALWGSGHATGQLLIGLGCLGVHVGIVGKAWGDALGQASGFLVGASLVGIGLLGFNETRRYEAEESNDEGATPKGRFGWATYATGVLHGLSPDALIFIAPALALPRLAAAFHVAGVVTGTLISMGAYTALLSIFCRLSSNFRQVSLGASWVAVLLGACIIVASFGFTVPLPGL